MTEAENIILAAQQIRTKEFNMKKKYSFELKFTYWDGDDLLLDMKLENTRALHITRESGDIVVTSDSGYKCPGKFTVRPDQLVEMFVVGREGVDKMLMVQDSFSDTGDINLVGLTVPGIFEMKKWCKGIDEEIVAVAKSLRKKSIEHSFKKIWIEMGGKTTKPEDRVAKRVSYMSKVTAAWQLDKEKWGGDLKRVGLLK